MMPERCKEPDEVVEGDRSSRRRVFITGTAGFIGFHLSKAFLAEGFRVLGYDGMTDYYDVGLKRRRSSILLQNDSFSFVEGMLEDQSRLDDAVDRFCPEAIIHLAAQAGVRYSLQNPRAYLDSNVIGSFNVMEAARRNNVRHLLIASTSSVYGANDSMPFTESQKADTQLTIYAATKKANESMAHAYAHLWNLPTTMFRFFTVYGPWGRPDLALFKFVDAILDGRPIEVFNNGDMHRDFTYIDDLVEAIRLLLDTPPSRPSSPSQVAANDSLSPVAPFRIVNIGNSSMVRLTDFIEAIENCLGKKAVRKNLPMQPGDVPATWADTTLLHNITGFRPKTDVRHGVAEFIAWFREYYQR